LLRLTQDVVAAAHKARRPVTVCGEIAADPLGCLALAALQVDSLSVPVTLLRGVRRIIAGQNARALKKLAPELLRQRTAADVRALLSEKLADTAGRDVEASGRRPEPKRSPAKSSRRGSL
jgi:phosphoenolpyruvate-protein kinase (PTS system EI component)